ncbi:RNase A-like domain-containing protein [Streptomyces hokutonensis]|uniref:RNase A-like domain-containing protein n=1 Tax=Streptomyces hokutonensis TaxID=1306990 RepID=UPI0037F6B3C9
MATLAAVADSASAARGWVSPASSRSLSSSPPTQGVLDDPGNQQKIANWLASNPNPDRSKRTVGLTFNDTVGRTWTRGDSAAHDSHIVNVTLKPRPGGHPPYVVLTSMPSDTVQS